MLLQHGITRHNVTTRRLFIGGKLKALKQCTSIITHYFLYIHISSKQCVSFPLSENIRETIELEKHLIKAFLTNNTTNST